MRQKKKSEEVLLTGTISVHPRGFGFVVVEEGEDVFIPKSRMKGAMDRDTVQIRLFTPTSSKGPEGEIVKIIARKRSHILGIVEKQLERNSWQLFSPILGREKKVVVSGKNLKLEQGDRVLCEIEKWDEALLTGTVAKKMGSIHDPKVDIDAAIVEYEIRSLFPEKVLQEVEAISQVISKSEIAKRTDLRHLPAITIDPDTAKDFDDALTCEMTKEGHFLLGVHIADVSHFVPPFSALDKEAQERANSTYFPGRCIPMLPPILSDNLCSLQPNKIRLTATVMIKFDQEGNMVNFSLFRSLIKSQKRFTYKEAKEVLDGEKRSKFLPHLSLMRDLALLLKKKRAARGSFEFSMPEYLLKVGEDGNPTGFELVEYDITHQLVEEFMLKANEVVAIHLSNLGKNLPYRIHDEPTEEAMEEFIFLARMAGFPLPKKPKHEDLQALFKDERLRSILAPQFIRRMKMAFYSTNNIGHFGLKLTHYCHFTSPIRRYVDLVAHRILFGAVDDLEHLEWLVQHTSERERISAKAEISVKTIKKIRFAMSHFSLSPQKIYSAMITKMKPFGLFFEVEEFSLEGFFHVSELGSDWWYFDPTQMSFVGERTKKSYRLGDKIEVQIEEIDLLHQEVAWVKIDSEKSVEKTKRAKR